MNVQRVLQTMTDNEFKSRCNYHTTSIKVEHFWQKFVVLHKTYTNHAYQAADELMILRNTQPTHNKTKMNSFNTSYVAYVKF